MSHVRQYNIATAKRLDLERKMVDLTHEILQLGFTRDYVLDDQALDRIIKDLESERDAVNARLKSVYADLRALNASLQSTRIVGTSIPCHNRLAGVNDGPWHGVTEDVSEFEGRPSEFKSGGAGAPLFPEDDGSDADVW